jgi:hypothetical protein
MWVVDSWCGHLCLVPRELPFIQRLYNTNFTLCSRFKVAEVGFMMHWEDSTTGAQGDNNADFSKAFREHASMQTNSGRESMHGLQVALQEGWLVQRGRELCSFSHDRYHQAARDLAKAEWPVAKMSYRVRFVSTSKKEVS